MAFVDEITIHAKAGRGGDGVVRWRHEKFIEKGGPWGGNGGKGGDVYARAVRDVHLLAKYRTKKEFAAGGGEPGASRDLHGKNGSDIDIELPVGSIITNKNTGKTYRLDNENDRIRLLEGGVGGFGNTHFKSSTNVTPKESTKGKPGDEADLFIEVELTADIGLIGLPNAGKTTLLNTLTAAKGKVGDYPFTTLEPNLGECFGYIIADIPGLIEGAGSGKGLGHTFLRHIRRTRMLLHLISLENEDVAEAYRTIRKELTDFDDTLLDKKELVVLTKIDIAGKPEDVADAVRQLKELNPEVYTVSVLDDDSVKVLRENVLKSVQ